MTRDPATHASKASGLPGAMLAAAAILDKIPQSLISLAARIFPAAVFWRSGETKVEGWHVTDNAIALFKDEYALPLIDPALAAKIAAFSEHFFPVLLVIGFASRLSAPLASISFRRCSSLVLRAGYGARPSRHDRRHRNFRLSRLLAGAWRLGHLFSYRHRPWSRHLFSRPSVGKALVTWRAA